MRAPRVAFRDSALVIGLLIFATWAEPAGRLPHAQRPEFPAELEIVDVYATVTDEAGRFVPGLTISDFRVLEGGAEQKVIHFSSEDSPYTVGLVLDRSGSMAGMIREVFDAALHTMEASKADDQAFVMVFDNRVELVQDFTPDRKALERALGAVRAGGETALYDAILASLDHAAGGRHRKKALLVVTDGLDNRSATSFERLLSVASGSGVLVYVVGFFAQADAFTRVEEAAKEELARLSQVTGGRAYFPTNMKDCKQACLDIANELRHQYHLGYSLPRTTKAGEWRTIRVETVAPSQGRIDRRRRLTVRARTGYYAKRN